MKQNLTLEELIDLVHSVEIDEKQITEDTRREKIKQAVNERPPITEETRERQREASAGRNAGRIQSEEERITHGRKNHIVSDETKIKIGDANRDRVHGPKPEKVTQKTSLSMTKYVYTTPRGIFYSRHELSQAYPEYTLNQMVPWATRNMNGFSRKIKEEDETKMKIYKNKLNVCLSKGYIIGLDNSKNPNTSIRVMQITDDYICDVYDISSPLNIEKTKTDIKFDINTEIMYIADGKQQYVGYTDISKFLKELNER